MIIAGSTAPIRILSVARHGAEIRKGVNLVLVQLTGIEILLAYLTPQPLVSLMAVALLLRLLMMVVSVDSGAHLTLLFDRIIAVVRLVLMLRFRTVKCLGEGMSVGSPQVAHTSHIVQDGKLHHGLECVVELPLESQVGLRNGTAIKYPSVCVGPVAINS